jgi:transcriptional regulator of met regulon
LLDALVTDENTARKVLNLLDAEGSEFLANTVNDTKDSRSTTQK